MTPAFGPEKGPHPLPAIGGWPQQAHLFDDRSVWAVQAALATGRPLLVRGEPGTGKSQLARAAAHVLKWPLLCEVITSRSESTDLLWRFDAVSRLGEAQIQGSMTASGLTKPEAIRSNLDPLNFLQPGRLWWALNWRSALAQAGKARCALPDGMPANGLEKDQGCVVLVDEIDKADADVPNGLLECLANQSFHVPYLSSPVARNADQPNPLVVITTNEERELPAAFLRRCLVLHYSLPREQGALKAWLIERGEAHFPQQKAAMKGDFGSVLAEAANQLILDRSTAQETGLAVPGQAEYLDLLRAVFEIASLRSMAPMDVLKMVKDFTLKKNPEQVR